MADSADVVELLRYNAEAKVRACPHARQRLIFRDVGYSIYNICLDCEVPSLPPSGPEWDALKKELRCV